MIIEVRVTSYEVCIYLSKEMTFSLHWSASRLTNLIIQPGCESCMFLKVTFFRYCGQTAPKFENTVFDLGRARWLIIFNNTLHKERGKIIFNENIKLWLYNSVKKSDHKFLQLYVSA